MNIVSEYFSSNSVANDTFSLICGEKLGEGAYRTVYEFLPDSQYVIKFETAAQSFSNIREWDVWERVEGTDYARWFAPCYKISPSGSVLLQRKVEPARMSEMPDKVPAFFTDLKIKNWGLLGKRIVCCDYGNHLLFENGLTKRMKKAVWWGADWG